MLRYIRHELGHAVDNAFDLRKDRKRKFIFGSPDISTQIHINQKYTAKNMFDICLTGMLRLILMRILRKLLRLGLTKVKIGVLNTKLAS